MALTQVGHRGIAAAAHPSLAWRRLAALPRGARGACRWKLSRDMQIGCTLAARPWLCTLRKQHPTACSARSKPCRAVQFYHRPRRGVLTPSAPGPHRLEPDHPTHVVRPPPHGPPTKQLDDDTDSDTALGPTFSRRPWAGAPLPAGADAVALHARSSSRDGAEPAAAKPVALDGERGAITHAAGPLQYDQDDQTSPVDASRRLCIALTHGSLPAGHTCPRRSVGPYCAPAGRGRRRPLQLPAWQLGRGGGRSPGGRGPAGAAGGGGAVGLQRRDTALPRPVRSRALLSVPVPSGTSAGACGGRNAEQ